MRDENEHVPVLLAEVVKGLAVKPGGIYIDATFGRGGHSMAILSKLNDNGRLYLIDKDAAAISFAMQQFSADSRVTIAKSTFACIGQLADEWQITGRVGGIVLDLGLSSPQVDDPARGFSFQHDGNLDMRMDNESGEPAAAWLARASEKDIAHVLKTYGEERHAKRIAKTIVRTRQDQPITHSLQLADLIASVVPRERNKHPATRSFQAIRIYINQELDDLRECLARSLEVLAVSGRIAVVSFHSLEDRIVKRFFRACSSQSRTNRRLPAGQPTKNVLKIVGKAMRPAKSEIKLNPRARSAVLRIAERMM